MQYLECRMIPSVTVVFVLFIGGGDGMAQNLGRTRAMTVRVLVVDDEPDVESLFRQQFRREVREGLYTLDFALSALSALAILLTSR